MFDLPLSASLQPYPLINPSNRGHDESSDKTRPMLTIHNYSMNFSIHFDSFCRGKVPFSSAVLNTIPESLHSLSNGRTKWNLHKVKM